MSTAAPTGTARGEPMDAATRAGFVVRSHIGDQIDALGRAIALTERHETGSVGRTCAIVHRIRTAVRGFRHLFIDSPRGGPELDRLQAALKHAEDLEALRDHFTDRFAQAGLAAGEYPRWHHALESARTDGYREVDRISSQAWVAVLLEQVRLFADHARFAPDGLKPASSLIGVLTRAKHRLLDAHAGQGHALDLEAARERTREAAREAHDLAATVRPALGRAVDDLLIPVTDLERLLGRYRLSAIARNWLLRLPAADRAERLTAGLLDLERRELLELSETVDEAAAAMARLWR
ncbi:hypothetical protein GCM10027447_35430 [Glycomyces halotolerans]